jgi:hypothetical protein
MKMKILYLAAFLAAFPASAAYAQQLPAGAKINQLIIYGKDQCPASSENEIIVCARKPESDRYRVPENLRGEGDPASSSWTNQATELSYAGRTGIGSCSPVGPGGITGCLGQLINQAKAERGGADSVNWNRLIEDARQRRLGKIDAESDAIQQEEDGNQ